MAKKGSAKTADSPTTIRNRVKPVKADGKDAQPTEVEHKHVPRRGINGFLHSLFDPVDNSVLSLYRFGWGMIMLWESISYLRAGGAKVDYYFLATPFHFKYWGFDWVVAFPSSLMYFHFHFLSVLSICFAVGLCYRLSAILFFLAFTYFYLIDMALYLNHFYLVAVISVMFIFLPAHQDWSVDSLIWRSWRKPTMPRWVIYLLRSLIIIVYFYAAVAKMNMDWLRGEPLRHWLAKRHKLALIGPFLLNEWSPYFFSYGGIAIDLIAAPMLLFSKTRWLGLLGTISFHMLNKYIFSIGIFPAVMLLTSAVFFHPGWPRKLFRAMYGATFIAREEHEKEDEGNSDNDDTSSSSSSGDDNKKSNTTNNKTVKGKTAIGSAGSSKVVKHKYSRRHTRPFTTTEILTLIVLGIFILYQIFMPLRYLIYPGDVAWTEWGHRWSWRMKLRDKNCDTMLFLHPAVAISQDGKNVMYGSPQEINPLQFLNPKQVRKMGGRPEMIQQLAHFIADQVLERNLTTVRPKITAKAMCQLNFRTPADLIDPDFDLAGAPLWEFPNEWQTLYPPDLTPEEVNQLPWNWNWEHGWRWLIGKETQEEKSKRELASIQARKNILEFVRISKNEPKSE